MQKLGVSPHGLKEIQSVIKRKRGIDTQQYKEEFLITQVQKRLEKENIEEANYILQLKNDGTEIDNLLSCLTVYCTSFFRDIKKYEVLEKFILPDLILKNEKSKRLKIWSAGCAAGEEPYSIAMTVASVMGPKLVDWKIEILATDINQALLDIAGPGVYEKAQLRPCESKLFDHYTRESPSNSSCLEIDKPIKDLVSFSKLNLISDAFPQHVDLIFCRNVLIYMKTKYANEIHRKFHESLSEGGILMLGNFESLMSQFLTWYERLKINKEFIYRKIIKGSHLYNKMAEKEKQLMAGLGVESLEEQE